MTIRISIVFTLILVANLTLPLLSAQLPELQGDVELSRAQKSLRRSEYEKSECARLILERANVVDDSILINAVIPGLYNQYSDFQDETVMDPVRFDSWFLHFDPVGEENHFVDGSITFPRRMLGVIGRSLTMEETDSVYGHPATLYPTNRFGREPEFNNSGDFFQISSDMRTLTFCLRASDLDQLRIIVEAGPTTIAAAKQQPFITYTTVENVVITNLVDTVASDNVAHFQIEDKTGGATIFCWMGFHNSVVSDYQVGDVVSITGITQSFMNLFEFDQTIASGSFQIVDQNENVTVEPVLISTTDLLDFSSTAEALESRLVTLRDIRFNDKSNPTTPGEIFDGVANYQVSDGRNTVEVRISTDGIADKLGIVPFASADLTGVFGQFSEFPDQGYQLLVTSMTILGDLNQDNLVNLLDVLPFVDLLNNQQFQFEADINRDGLVDLLDVNLFVDLFLE